MSRLSVKHELRIVDSLFPPDCVPDDLTPKSRAGILLRVATFTLSYLVLAWFANSIVIASACLCAIGTVDYWTRREINAKFERYFADAQFSPRQGEKGTTAIEARRAVIDWYLFTLPHLREERWRLAGFVASLCLAGLALHTQSGLIENVAYVVLIGTLIANEVMTVRWRVERDIRLRIASDSIPADGSHGEVAPT